MLLVAATPSMEAIQAATLTSARNLRVERTTGSLEKGKAADLVVVDGNPLDDIKSLRRVTRVMKEGRIVHKI